MQHARIVWRHARIARRDVAWRRTAMLAFTLALLAPAAAEARKECRSAEPSPSATTEEAPSSGVAWARGNDSSWVHAADPSWAHDTDDAWVHDAEEEADSVAYQPGAHAGWVHETDYGWWAAGPDAGLNELEEEVATEDEGDCTVSRDRNECVVLANQVANYRFRLELAEERADALWAANLEATIDRLEARARRRGCPWVGPTVQEQIEQTVAAVARAVGVAAQAAAMFYRMGLF